MRFAYADPPYIGQAKKHYGKQPDYAGEVDHEALIKKLMDYDGWALSCHTNSLRSLLPLCPPKTRIGVWTKPFAYFKPGTWPYYAWEPILFIPMRSGKEMLKLGFRSGRDWVSCNVWGVTAKERAQVSVKGRKPHDFCFWLFKSLGATIDDDFDDLFPGSGAVSREWNLYRLEQLRDQA